MPIEYKTIELPDGGGKVIPVNDKGHPIIIRKEKDGDGAGTEIGLDAIHLYRQVPALQEEAKGHRLKASARGEKLKLLTDVGVDWEGEDFGDWVSTASGAVETVKNLEAGDLVKAGEVETIKKQAEQNLQKKLDDATKANEKVVNSLTDEKTGLEKQLYELMVADQFNTSEYVKDKLNMTAKGARRYFGNNFKVEKQEDGSFLVIGYYDRNGVGGDREKIYSVEKPGTIADFAECLEILVDNDPDRKSLLKGSAAAGGGAGGGGGGSDFEGVNPWAKDTRNLTIQGQIIRKDPEKARRLAAAAGVTLDLP